MLREAMTTTTSHRPRYPDPGGNQSMEWIQGFWPSHGDWDGFEEKLNQDARSTIERTEDT